MRFLFFLAVCLVIFLVLRRLTRPQEYSAQQVSRVMHSTAHSGETVDDFPRLQVISHYFREIDAATGPPDRDVFYDELFVDVLDPTGRDIWKYSFFVATPKGVAHVMSEEKWEYVYSTDLLIVKTFDMDLILEAVVEHLEEQHELPRAVERKVARKGREYLG